MPVRGLTPEINIRPFTGGGGTFTVSGVERDRDTLTLGAGLEAQSGDRLSGYLDFVAVLSGDQRHHALSAGVRYSF